MSWKCSLCGNLNALEENIYHCSLCDAFHPREAPFPSEYGDPCDPSTCPVFPSRAPKAYITRYYSLHLLKHLQSVLPEEIIECIVQCLDCMLEIGQQVDVMYARVWYTAHVIELDQQARALVAYEGWNQRWNEWVHVQSHRVQPYRAKSVGDTSSRKTKHLHVRRPSRRVWELLIQHLVRLGYSYAEARNTLTTSREGLEQAMHALRLRYAHDRF
jgi:hypothetical protein